MKMLVVSLLGVLGLMTTTPALAQGEGCTAAASVTWSTAGPPWVVVGATVEVPGCDNGESVGLQLITADGDQPAEPLFQPADAGEVRFDLASLSTEVEEVTGVRVLLAGGTQQVAPPEVPERSAGDMAVTGTDVLSAVLLATGLVGIGSLLVRRVRHRPRA